MLTSELSDSDKQLMNAAIAACINADSDAPFVLMECNSGSGVSMLVFAAMVTTDDLEIAAKKLRKCAQELEPEMKRLNNRSNDLGSVH